ncbi:MAG: ATP-binding protein [Pseudomonadota bacterium]|nr:ATP-binding protein [Pseudomonadota bacterium]
MSNAVKFTTSGAIQVSVERDEDMVSIAVIDPGRGISPERQAKLFRQFEPGDGPGAGTGLGLGLWISLDLAKKLGGALQVESILGLGSRFTLTFPVHTEWIATIPVPLAS